MKRIFRLGAAVAACGALALLLLPASALAQTVTTGGAINVTSTSATLVGFLDPAQIFYAYAFEYGTSVTYDHATPIQTAPAGNGLTEVTATVTGLWPGPRTTSSWSRRGRRVSQTLSLRLRTSAATRRSRRWRPGSGNGHSPNPNGSLRLIGKTLSVSSGKATVAFWCLGSKACRGSFSISASGKSCVSGKSFSIGAGKVKAVTPGLRRVCKTRLGKASGHRLGGKLRAALSTGQPALTSKVTLARRT